METMELYDLVKDFFGYKIRLMYINSSKKQVCGTLYDSFFLECDLDDRYGRFGAGLYVSKKYCITDFLGERSSLNSDPESIKKSLQIIDNYCRLRLPDKFLEAYYQAYVLSQYDICDE